MSMHAGPVHRLQVGFMPLIDCAPLVAAARLGLDRRHGLALELRRQASWAAVRDRLLSGELDAAHALAGLVHGVQCGVGGPQADLAILLTLNQNGQGIVLATPAAEALAAGVALPQALDTLGRPATLAHTFPTGTHAMWLHYWLAAQGVHPLRDVRCVTLPPSRMAEALAQGEIDGYCAGEPWGLQAEALGAGRRVIASGRIWPGHPEKVLACRRDFAGLQPELATALTATVLDACRWLDEPEHRREAADWLADPEIIGLPAERLRTCLLPADADPDTALRFHAGGAVNVPWLSDAQWFLHQFRRWGWLSEQALHARLRELPQVLRHDLYRRAAEASGVPVPATPCRSSHLFDGALWEGNAGASYAT